ncbi:hypothetical protein [Flavobacterium channae]|uniref:hypothetical protein n=1 Tax=Flavobacterium channae TaxID=2897181 RepID=UPI001E408E7B|nr:hypothetical protein [Flavobacterium channae]UGS24212.1 hypothetical protein LOS89_02815 [Flavobacterium channae]
MKRFIKRIFVFSLLTFIMLIGIIVSSNILINKDSNFSIDKNYAYIVLGHSHPEEAFNDSVIQKTKNFARGGEHYFYTYLKAKKIIESNPNVKVVFLELTNNQISTDMTKWIEDTQKNLVNIPNFAPVMTFEDHSFLIKQNPWSYFKSQEMVIKNNLNFLLYRKKNILNQRDWGGFYANPRQKVDSIIKSNEKQKKLNSTKIVVDTTNLPFVDKIASICKKRGIQLFLIRSPQHPKYIYCENEEQLQKILKTRYSQLFYLDFENFYLLNDDYADLEHLNYKGAKKFSLFFDALLKKGLVESSNPEQLVQDEIVKHNTIK